MTKGSGMKRLIYEKEGLGSVDGHSQTVCAHVSSNLNSVYTMPYENDMAARHPILALHSMFPQERHQVDNDIKHENLDVKREMGIHTPMQMM